jgi:hypothetical protein
MRPHHCRLPVALAITQARLRSADRNAHDSITVNNSVG